MKIIDILNTQIIKITNNYKIVHQNNNNIIIEYKFKKYYNIYKNEAFEEIQNDISNYLFDDIWPKIIRFVIIYPLDLYDEIIKIENDQDIISFVKQDNKKMINYIFKYKS